MSVIKKETIDVRRVGTALIGGDFTGNARGTNCIDIQTERTAVTQIPVSNNSICIGQRNTAGTVSGYERNTAIGHNNTNSGYYDSTAVGSDNTISAGGSNCTTIGHGNAVSGSESTAIGTHNTVDNLSIAAGYLNTVSRYACAFGYNHTVSGYYSSALGYQCTASAYYTHAWGNKAKARIEKTTNICGPQIIRKDDGETAGAAFESFCGVEDILVSKEVDMKAVADHTITLPANCHFWLNEVGIIATNIAGLVAQPTVRYGITGDLDKHGAAAATTALTANLKREIETPLVPEDGETSLTGGTTIAANADTFNGRFYWKGMLIEDE